MKAWLQQSSSIQGVAIIAAALVAYLLDAVTPDIAVSMVAAGILLLCMKQRPGPSS